MSSKKDLLLLCLSQWEEIATVLRNEPLTHIVYLKQRALSKVSDNKELVDKINTYYFSCPACYIARQHCKKCMLLDVWGYTKETVLKNSDDYLCMINTSPYFTVSDINNGVSRLKASLLIIEGIQQVINTI